MENTIRMACASPARRVPPAQTGEAIGRGAAVRISAPVLFSPPPVGNGVGVVPFLRESGETPVGNKIGVRDRGAAAIFGAGVHRPGTGGAPQ